MKIATILEALESLAPPAWQEDYDNAGLLTGSREWDCTGVLITLDITEEILAEAFEKGCNLVVAHHPVIFSGLKKINGSNQVERCVIRAIKQDMALYAIHTNLDNAMHGVNARIADKLGLINRHILAPREGGLRKLFTFVPPDHAEKLRAALFAAGGGHIGNYSGVSFNAPGTGSFTAGAGARPFVGQPGLPHLEQELKIEVIFPRHLQAALITALKQTHPYEEVAYDIIDLENKNPFVGSGLVGELAEPLPEQAFLQLLKDRFGAPVIRHSVLSGKPVRWVALCGGAGSFLISNALENNVDFFVTADVKYHSFFEGERRMVIADIGHFESEQFTIDLLHDALVEKFRNFAILKTGTSTNPVHYYF
jgi:dinuclear metal center YbgI/SA1388 family protein